MAAITSDLLALGNPEPDKGVPCLAQTYQLAKASKYR
jgi:hypothetical protein